MDKVPPSEIRKACRSLISGFPNEVDFALNVCTLLSNEGKHSLKLNHDPHILDYMLAHVGVYSSGKCVIQLLWYYFWNMYYITTHVGNVGWILSEFLLQVSYFLSDVFDVVKGYLLIISHIWIRVYTYCCGGIGIVICIYIYFTQPCFAVYMYSVPYVNIDTWQSFVEDWTRACSLLILLFWMGDFKFYFYSSLQKRTFVYCTWNIVYCTWNIPCAL